MHSHGEVSGMMRSFVFSRAFFFGLLGATFALLNISNAAAQTLFQDGYESGNLSYTQNSIRWGSTTNSAQGRVSVSALKPRTGTYSLQFLYPGMADGQDGWAEQRLEMNSSHTEVWIMFDLYIPANYYHRSQGGGSNNKFFALYRNPYSSPGFQVNFSTIPNGSGGSNLEIHSYNNGSENPIQTPDSGRSFITAADAGKWQNIVMHFKVPTGQGTGDGVMQMWKNGAQVVNITNLAAWGGTDKNYFDAAYILGWSNSGFASETTFYVDNFVISDTPLGVNPPGAPSLTGVQ